MDCYRRHRSPYLIRATIGLESRAHFSLANTSKAAVDDADCKTNYEENCPGVNYMYITLFSNNFRLHESLFFFLQIL